MSNKQVKDFSELDEIVIKATSKRLKFLVKRIGLSQSQLAKILDRDSKTISNYYCGKSLPDKKDLIVLSRVLGVSYDDILVFKGDIEGYQRTNRYHLEFDEKTEKVCAEFIKNSSKDSKLFNTSSQGCANIRNLEEATIAMQFLHFMIEEDISSRMMAAILYRGGIYSDYMHHIYEVYIWEKLSEEQKLICQKQFAYLRGESEEEPSFSERYNIKKMRP
ncbi:hypothetical protein C1N61_30290 (plasmid) [Priestia aryabhattai]